ncbi:MAG: GNAT family N-acetyltransferase [Alphaproteobacteria bacterium]|nr:GNAT family N-acetyltransferase [Alphaproteobacteria bacterium]
MSLKIRALAAPDREAWEPLWAGYLDFYEADLSDEVTDQTWARLIEPGIDPNGFCAVTGPVSGEARIVGIVHYLFHASCWSLGPYCYLQDLFVDPEIRGSGAGRALIEAVYRAADEHGASQVYWLTQHFNETARRLYDRIGVATPFMKYNRV